jgi:hypothetical protein
MPDSFRYGFSTVWSSANIDLAVAAEWRRGRGMAIRELAPYAGVAPIDAESRKRAGWVKGATNPFVWSGEAEP